MKKIVAITVMLLIMASCKSQNADYISYGEKIDTNNAQKVEALAEQYKLMKVGDSIDYKLMARVDEVCQAKGCWMTLNLEDGNKVMVKFKDYGFFVPKDISGKEVIVKGKAFVSEFPVEELQHYAEDAGKSAEDIAQITNSKKTYSFEAEGVLIKQ